MSNRAGSESGWRRATNLEILRRDMHQLGASAGQRFAAQQIDHEVLMTLLYEVYEQTLARRWWHALIWWKRPHLEPITAERVGALRRSATEMLQGTVAADSIAEGLRNVWAAVDESRREKEESGGELGAG